MSAEAMPKAVAIRAAVATAVVRALVMSRCMAVLIPSRSGDAIDHQLVGLPLPRQCEVSSNSAVSHGAWSPERLVESRRTSRRPRLPGIRRAGSGRRSRRRTVRAPDAPSRSSELTAFVQPRTHASDQLATWGLEVPDPLEGDTILIDGQESSARPSSRSPGRAARAPATGWVSGPPPPCSCAGCGRTAPSTSSSAVASASDPIWFQERSVLCGPAPTPVRQVVTTAGGGLLFSGVSRLIDSIHRHELQDDLLSAVHQIWSPATKSKADAIAERLPYEPAAETAHCGCGRAGSPPEATQNLRSRPLSRSICCGCPGRTRPLGRIGGAGPRGSPCSPPVG